jgi:hypothetical protein
VEDLQRIGHANRVRSALFSSALGAVLLAGCGSEPSRAVPSACKDQVQVTRALERAPGTVRIDGMPLSGCFVAGADAGDVEAVGLAFLPVAQRLARDPHGREAVRLGFLIGAVRRGVAGGKVYGELGRRIEQELAGVDTSTPEFRRGERAGRDHG